MQEKFDKITFGQKVAETVTNFVGSWKFIIVQSCILFCWVLFNIFSPWTFDSYPFILMNLFLSLQAAYTAPLIMLGTNRIADMDRKILYKDYKVSRDILEYLHNRLEWQDDKIDALLIHLDVAIPKKIPITYLNGEKLDE